MKKSVVYLKNFSFIYENNEYTFDDVLKKQMIFKNLKIIILEEMLYIKSFLIESKINNLEDYVLNKISEIFPENNEILYDYERTRDKNSIYVYSIKGREKIESLCEKSISLQVIPVQFIIRDYINKKLYGIKEKYIAIAKIYDRYYFIEYDNGVFVDNYISENITDLQEYLRSKDFNGKIYMDEKIYLDEYMNKKLKIIKIDIARLINEKV
ncbi:MAG: hypothetical protein ACI398_03020 [Clostridium sp.]